MISQFFILSARGDTIINRDCKFSSHQLLTLFQLVRHDLVKNTPEIFFRNVKLYKGDAPPIFVSLFSNLRIIFRLERGWCQLCLFKERNRSLSCHDH